MLLIAVAMWQLVATHRADSRRVDPPPRHLAIGNCSVYSVAEGLPATPFMGKVVEDSGT